jgi:acyl-CoA thioesterase I
VIQPAPFFGQSRTAGHIAPLSRRGLLAGSAAALASAGILDLGRAPRPALAQPATPMATPSPVDFDLFVQFVHFDKFLAGFGAVLSEEQLAGLYYLDVETYREIRNQFDANARQAAEELLADDDFAQRVDRLPFAPGDTVVGFGDSITDDLQSWLEILRHLLALRRPDDQIIVVNQGISGDSTSDALARFVPILQSQPAWVIVMLGTNDAFPFGNQATKTAVSHDESAKNLVELRHLAAAKTTAKWAWITSPPCDEELIAAGPFAVMWETSLRNDDLDAIADVVRGQPEPFVDLFAVFGKPPATELMLTDGIHPSLAGQQATVRALVERLTE